MDILKEKSEQIVHFFVGNFNECDIMEKPGGKIMKRNINLKGDLLILSTALVLMAGAESYQNQSIKIEQSKVESTRIVKSEKPKEVKVKEAPLNKVIEIEKKKIITIDDILEADIEYLKNKEVVVLEEKLYRLTQEEFDIVLIKLSQMKNIKSLSVAEDFPVSPEFSPRFTEENVLKLFEVISSFENIEVLKLNAFDYITDISSISKMKKLRELVLTCSNITDLSVLESLVNLEVLDLSLNSSLKDIKSLKYLVNLKKLSLSYTSVENLESLEALVNLEELSLSSYKNENKYESLESLNKLTELTYLSISNFESTNLSFVKNMTKLKYLSLKNGKIQDISDLKNCTDLETLDLEHNEIEDISVLTNIPNIEYLRLGYNSIENIEVLSKLNKLRVLWIKNNNIKNIDSLNNIITLTFLDLRDNKISNIGALNNLKNINTIYLLGNKIPHVDLILFLIEHENVEVSKCFSDSDLVAYEDLIHMKRDLKNTDTLGVNQLLNYDVKYLEEYECVYLNESLFNCTQEEYDIILTKLTKLPNLKKLKIIGPPCYPMYDIGIGKSETVGNIEKLTEVIKQLKELESLKIAFVYLMDDVSFVCELPNLTELDLAGNSIPFEVLEEVYEAINNKKLIYDK